MTESRLFSKGTWAGTPCIHTQGKRLPTHTQMEQQEELCLNDSNHGQLTVTISLLKLRNLIPNICDLS